MCGAYDLHLPDYDDGIMGRFQRDIIWAYTGQKDFLNSPSLAYASLPQHVTGELPPTFISAGNGDPLEAHSHSMAQALEEDRKSTRLNSSHVAISYAVFCLKKKNNTRHLD